MTLAHPFIDVLRFKLLYIKLIWIMQITYIHLENWKNFHHCAVDLSNRCFIVGPNASGKSNFLDALRFLRDIVKQGGGLQTAVDSRGGMNKIRCLSARSKTDILIELHINEQGERQVMWEYLLDFKQVGGGIQKKQVSIISERVVKNGNIILNRTHKDESEDAETLKYTLLQQATANKEFRVLHDFINDFQYLNVIPQLVREPDPVNVYSDKEDFYGRNFLQKLSLLNERTRNSYFRKINDVLKLAVPQLDELCYRTDSMGVPHIEARYKHWRAKGARQQESQFSDGTLRLIGFLFALVESRGVVLLEEPETNLHTAIIAKLPEFIAKMQRTKKNVGQVLITTHSYDILSNEGISGDEVLLLRPSAEGTNVIRISDIDEVRNELEAGLTVADSVLPMTRPEDIDNMSQINF